MRTYEILAVVAASTLLSACKNESADVNLTIDAAAPLPPPVIVDAAAPVPTPIPPPPPVVMPPTTPKSTTTSDAGAGTSLDAGASDAAAPTTDAGVSGKLDSGFRSSKLDVCHHNRKPGANFIQDQLGRFGAFALDHVQILVFKQRT